MWHSEGYIPCADPAYRAEWWDVSTGDKAMWCQTKCMTRCDDRQRCLSDALRAEGSLPVNHRQGTRGGLGPRARWRLHRGIEERDRDRRKHGSMQAAASHRAAGERLCEVCEKAENARRAQWEADGCDPAICGTSKGRAWHRRRGFPECVAATQNANVRHQQYRQARKAA